jgi:transcriptional regulator with XRE-family HTH domain
MAADEAEQKATRKTNTVDSTGQVVAANIARIRTARGLSTYRLAELLANDAHRPIAPSAITRIEAGSRKVDVDDLMAFAVALKVSPTALLLEPTTESYLEVTGAGIVKAEIAWQWLYGERPLEEDLPANDDGEVWNEFQTMSRPPGRREYRMTERLAEGIAEHAHRRRTTPPEFTEPPEDFE